MTGPTRIAGGLIDRSQTLRFRFDGREFAGHPGDTLASALLANGVRLMGRSFKYHRPRGPLGAGSEEPNALVELGRGARREPNTRATVAELFDGLEAASQNRWPSLGFDALAINDAASRFLTAGFYYKTFMWPRAFWERLYEPIIRRAAGLGRLSGEPDPDLYDKGFLHCDLLVIGAGPAGLAAALTAGRAGARVILADEDFRMGGRLNAEREEIGGRAATDWAAAAVADLASLANVRLMPRSTVFGAFDHGVYGTLERVADHVAEPAPGSPRQILWRIYAARAVLAAGATERPIAFADNDRPGIMLASAMRAYANRWSVRAGSRVAVFTGNDDGLRTARDMIAAGAEVTLIDARPDAAPLPGATCFAGAVVTGTTGRLGLKAVTLRLASGEARSLPCDALAMAGGWNPNLHLTLHQRGRPDWNGTINAFVPGRDLPPGLRVAGAAAGLMTTHAALRSGSEAARAALADLGRTVPVFDLPAADDAPPRGIALWQVPGKRRAWVDFQNDVTVKDITLAHQEGFRSVEHLKRYTTLGMATDQGRTANVSGLAVMADLTGRSIPETGVTLARPPYTPVAIAAFAGRSTGPDFRPRRQTPTHGFARDCGAVFIEAGQWMRAQYFPHPGETHWRETVDREVLTTRSSAGICDVSTLGKIEVTGPDAGAFLNRLYANGFAKLPVGRVRYGIMLREDGMVMDDGTTARLGDDHYVTTTTTANAGAVFRHMEFARQCLWPGLDVHLISSTDAWAQISVAGPKARALLAAVADTGHDLSDAALPYMGCMALTVLGGLPARLFRISFCGELGYELAVPAGFGDALIRALAAAGAPLGATLYGTEALGVMRIEKGHVAGNELNGTTTALMLGLGRLVAEGKDAIGTLLSRRTGLTDPDGLRLVGLRPVDPTARLVAGSHFVARGAPADAAHDEGYLTSAAHSPVLGHMIGLGLLRRGAARHGEVIRAVNPLAGMETEAEVVSPHFIDPDGVRLRG